MVFPLVEALEPAADDDGGGAARLSPEGPPRCGIVGGMVLFRPFCGSKCEVKSGTPGSKTVGWKDPRCGLRWGGLKDRDGGGGGWGDVFRVASAAGGQG
jgi:hypothetical protein